MAFAYTVKEVARSTEAGAGMGVVVDITMDAVNAYPSGGATLSGYTSADVLGIANIGGNTAGLGYVLFWNDQTGKLQILQSAASAAPLAEFSGTFSASTTVRGLLIGWV